MVAAMNTLLGSLLLVAPLVYARGDGFSGRISTMVTFGDSYSVQNVGSGRIQWQDWVAGYAGVTLYDYARSGATCSNALTPRIYGGVTEDELPVYFQQVSNGTIHINPDKTVYTIWIGTNDVGAGCLLTGDQAPGVSIVDTTACVMNWVKTLHQRGAKNFIIQNMVPLYRIPMYQANAYPTKYWTLAKNATEWNAAMQQLVKGGNALSKLMLADLAPSLPKARIALFDSFGLFNDMLDRPQLYLNGTAPYNTTGSANPCVYEPGASSATYCTMVSETEVDSYVWYNELHATNQANRVVAKEITELIRGRSSKWATWF
ncbi:hypothetical protein FRC17_009867 [Serendipita sp. 399]|nr:hypothetical protein FRC17_009867 [Serendipita sp. 399]